MVYFLQTAATDNMIVKPPRFWNYMHKVEDTIQSGMQTQFDRVSKMRIVYKPMALPTR